MYLILKAILTFTPLRIINISFEYIFYIIVAFFLTLIPAMITAFLCDFLSLFISGTIGTYHWVYAITPLLVTLCAFIFFSLLRSKYKWIKLLLPSIVMVLSTIIFAAVLAKQISLIDFEKSTLITISRTFGFAKVSYWVLIIFFILFTLLTISVCLLSFLAHKKQNKKLNYIAISISIVVLIIVVFRWIYGPYAYITFYNYINSMKEPRRFKTIGTDYLIWMYRFMFKSLFTIPIYVLILAPLMVPFAILRDQYYVSNYQNKY
ncbi:hypothetical protein [Mycoplasmopsis pullorum]|uniref:hypothetical protein n=1 Tax=Mycoplasmopsis pullorum TaxID=48003 RepID=UPI001119947E|nr:hypothetical protein [Mycoplasmopsis pullorum]